MTAIVGVLCSDGVVIGSDSSATFAAGQIKTIEQPVDKITIVHDRVIIAGTGQVGLGQRFCNIVETAYTSKVFTKDVFSATKELAQKTVQNFTETGAPKAYGALVAFVTAEKPQLCEFASGDFQPELKNRQMWYCSMGSGQLITDPFLALIREVFWRDGPPTVEDAIFAVTWTLDLAVRINPGGVNGPVKIAVLRRRDGKFAASMLDEADLDEHRQAIELAKERLRSVRQTLQDSQAPDLPRPPPQQG